MTIKRSHKNLFYDTIISKHSWFKLFSIFNLNSNSTSVKTKLSFLPDNALYSKV